MINHNFSCALLHICVENIIPEFKLKYQLVPTYCRTPVIGGDFTFAWDNKNNKNNPHLNFLKGTVLGDKKQGLGIRDKG